ncbi:M48 family metallopeptidase [Acuticoccus sp. I52.16.1]|uniref:M48 family metallopeptidase n=1 Tax=Acuticoccus sp. I52.16.1 TaxID=2928472 RepID=UPI001FCF9F7F|nr:SprT family zinc-dependent metalloprotease [Acuticoccus sp. I52.16.1]UOM32824.1 M48 family metallopeptidase [Acuticoccus sp. I52.16.1]
MTRLYAGRRSPVVTVKPDLPQREEITVDIATGPVVVELRRQTRARRMTLRVPPGGAAPIVTVPVRAPIGSAERFVRGQANWLAARLAERSPVVPFAAGATIPLRGADHEIRGTGRVRGTVSVEETEAGRLLWVPGAPEHVGRRLTTWLKAEARADLEAAVATYAAKVGKAPSQLKVKDTRAQWGSCSPSGVLSFSWRLVMAPPFVLQYVAAHEVAHLIELNHSAAFWKLNAELDPDHEAARAWLKRNGRMLHAIGAD